MSYLGINKKILSFICAWSIMFLNEPLFVFVAFIGITWYPGASDVQANMAPAGYPQAASYGAAQQMVAPQAQQGYNQYMQPDPYNQYSQAHAQAQAHPAYGGYNMQQPSYGHQYMQQWPQPQSYPNPYMSNLGQLGSQVMPQMQQAGYPGFNSLMQQGAGFMQPGGTFGNLANLFADLGKPQANRSQMSVINMGQKPNKRN
nr:uncharacterized protein LOC128671833 [Plodia interpunctella]